MKKTLLILSVIALNVITVTAQKAPTQVPPPSAPTVKSGTIKSDSANMPFITFESEVIDYGTIAHMSNGDREFKFKNTGKEPLLITEITRTCGCTTPVVPKEPIKPGESGVIKVNYDTKRVGQFEKTLTVICNAKNNNKQIKIKGTVSAPEIGPK